jgi:hypothetical protein
MVDATPPYVQTRVVAVSAAAAHRPYRDGRFWLGDTIRLSIRDTTMPPGDELRYRVCISFPHLRRGRCRDAMLTNMWRRPVSFFAAANDEVIARWWNGKHLIAERKLRITGGDGGHQ